MAFDQRSLDDYVDVAERMTEFYDRYPSGSLRAANPAKPWELAIVTGTKKDGTETTQTFIVYTAAAYRQPDDPAPGIGMAWEVFPGRTPYTLGSELMNAETSAWGRAMAALGIATKRGIASRQEVANRRAEREDGLPVNADGSLSRSRTTDDEKERAGVMTAAQQKEHTALRKMAMAAEGERVAVRLTETPDDDPFYDAAGPPILEPRTPLDPGTITPDQSKRIHAGFTALGIKNRDAYLAWTRRALGLDKLDTTADLSYRQAVDLLAALAARHRAEKGVAS